MQVVRRSFCWWPVCWHATFEAERLHLACKHVSNSFLFSLKKCISQESLNKASGSALRLRAPAHGDRCCRRRSLFGTTRRVLSQQQERGCDSVSEKYHKIHAVRLGYTQTRNVKSFIALRGPFFEQAKAFYCTVSLVSDKCESNRVDRGLKLVSSVWSSLLAVGVVTSGRAKASPPSYPRISAYVFFASECWRATSVMLPRCVLTACEADMFAVNWSEREDSGTRLSGRIASFFPRETFKGAPVGVAL